MKPHPAIPEGFTAATGPGGLYEGRSFTPLIQDPAPLAELDMSEYPDLTDEELETIAAFNTMYDGVTAEMAPRRFAINAVLLGRMFMEDGSENAYFEGIRKAWEFLPEEFDITGSAEFQAIEFMYYSTQNANGNDALLAMMMESSTVFSVPRRDAAA